MIVGARGIDRMIVGARGIERMIVGARGIETMRVGVREIERRRVGSMGASICLCLWVHACMHACTCKIARTVFALLILTECTSLSVFRIVEN